MGNFLDYGFLEGRSIPTNTGTSSPLGFLTPFDAATGNPQDEHGGDLPYYRSQGFYLAAGMKPYFYGPPVSFHFEATFRNAQGDEIGALGADMTSTFYLDRAENFTYSPTVTPGPLLAPQLPLPPGLRPATNNGATVFLDSASNQAICYTPVYRCDLPSGATVSATVTGLENTQPGGGVALYLLGTPNSFPTLASSGLLSAYNIISGDVSNPGIWTGGVTTGPSYVAEAWDAYWKDGDAWKHATSPAPGGTASFQLEWEDEDEDLKIAYVRVTQADGLIGWAKASNTVQSSAKGTIGVVQTPDGAFIMARAEGNPKAVVIRRMEANRAEGVVISTLAGRSRPRLALHRDGRVVLLSRNDTSKMFERKVSLDGGKTWPQ